MMLRGLTIIVSDLVRKLFSDAFSSGSAGNRRSAEDRQAGLV
jgi:hypothetical protein